MGINERLMTWCIPLTKNQHLTLISASAPTLITDEATKNIFYSALDNVLNNINKADKVVLMHVWEEFGSSGVAPWSDMAQEEWIAMASDLFHFVLLTT